MATAQTIITQAWIDIQVGAPGESPGANELSNGLAKLNMMLDNWSGARDLVYEIAQNLYTLGNVQSYPIGPTATAPFNVARPIRIENGMIAITLASNNILETPLDIISQTEWILIPDKGAKGVAPRKLYYDPQVPNAVLNFWPIPLSIDTTQVRLGTWNVVGQFSTLSTNANLPPAYLRAITLGLGLELVPTYGNIVNPAVVQMRMQQFQEAIAVVRQLNSEVQQIPLSPVNPNPAQPMQQPRAVPAQIAQG